MLTRFFKQSKPIPLFLTLILLVAYYISQHFLTDNLPEMGIANLALNLAIIVFNIFLMRFIIHKNNFQKSSNYSIFCLLLYLMIFPETLSNINMSLALMFNLFAFRRMLSMHSNIDLKKKVFDVGFWCFFSSLFWPPSILVLILAIIAVLFYASDNFRFYILPFLGFTAALVLHYTFKMLVFSTSESYISRLPDFVLQPELNYSSHEQIRIYFLIILSLFLLFFLPKIYTGLKLNMQRSLSLFAVAYALFAFALIFNVNENFSQSFFLIMPLAVITGNFLELKQLKTLWKEIFIWLLILAAIGLHFI
ncbi:DUF6427 family protein [Psychroflexus halocasei]|uniref:Beta-carotene 15,15'-monooxygenase n=1 Tax=Psychroflexus halocasei TaxID=908615 RepID=A0A1H4BN75_9FLAO|nr:DUF6427 family protein [Psychroflexus halocasei]SEA49252.1 hypothetical protein SAMN05421540_10696 [Psychroflexus halocasei]